MGGVISYMGDDYIAPSVEIQSDAHATDLDNSKVQTGQTIKSYIKANENIPISEADYAALTPEEIAEGKTYFRYEAPSLMRDIQDDGTATSLTSGALPTGQTITSYLNSNFVAKSKIVYVQASDVPKDGGSASVSYPTGFNVSNTVVIASFLTSSYGNINIWGSRQAEVVTKDTGIVLYNHGGTVGNVIAFLYKFG